MKNKVPYNVQQIVDAYPRSDEFNTLLFYHGPFSQWWYSYFVVEGIEYNCTEQFMMAEKARHFGDTEIEEQIMICKGPMTDQASFTKYPRRQKELGRQVRNFDGEEWARVARDLVKVGNIAKFTQSDRLRTSLISTGDYVLVEASPWDRIWGIGMDIEDERAFNPQNWKGTNWLGQVLTEVRTTIKPKGL